MPPIRFARPCGHGPLEAGGSVWRTGRMRSGSTRWRLVGVGAIAAHGWVAFRMPWAQARPPRRRSPARRRTWIRAPRRPILGCRRGRRRCQRRCRRTRFPSRTTVIPSGCRTRHSPSHLRPARSKRPWTPGLVRHGFLVNFECLTGAGGLEHGRGNAHLLGEHDGDGSRCRWCRATPNRDDEPAEHNLASD